MRGILGASCSPKRKQFIILVQRNPVPAKRKRLMGSFDRTGKNLHSWWAQRRVSGKSKEPDSEWEKSSSILGTVLPNTSQRRKGFLRDHQEGCSKGVFGEKGRINKKIRLNACGGKKRVQHNATSLNPFLGGDWGEFRQKKSERTGEGVALNGYAVKGLSARKGVFPLTRGGQSARPQKSIVLPNGTHHFGGEWE